MYLPSHTLFQDVNLFLTPTSQMIDIFALAFFHGLAVSISLSPPLLIAFRTLVFQGIPAGIASYLGIGLGQVIFLGLIYSGITPVIDFWYSIEPFLFLFGCGFTFFLLSKYLVKKSLYSLYLDNSREIIRSTDYSTLFKIAGIQILLMICNPPVSSFHLVSFPINESVFSISYFLFFFLTFFVLTFAFHSLLNLALQQLSKFATYVPVTGSIFQTKSPFANRINNLICFITSILIFTSFTHYNWRLFVQYIEGPVEIAATRKFHLDYKIDKNKNSKIVFTSKNRVPQNKKNINVKLTPRGSGYRTEQKFLYSNSQLSEKPRVRYLIELKDKSSLARDLKQQGSDRTIMTDSQRFNNNRSKPINLDRKGNPLRTVLKGKDIGELEALAKEFRSERLPEAVYKRYALNPLNAIQNWFLNLQIHMQKPASERRSIEEITRLRLKQADLLYKAAIAEIRYDPSSLSDLVDLERPYPFPTGKRVLHKLSSKMSSLRKSQYPSKVQPLPRADNSLTQLDSIQ